MKIFLKGHWLPLSLEVKQVALEVEASDTVAMVLAKLRKQESIDAHGAGTIALYPPDGAPSFLSKMKDESTLADHNIQPNATLRVKLQRHPTFNFGAKPSGTKTAFTFGGAKKAAAKAAPAFAFNATALNGSKKATAPTGAKEATPGGGAFGGGGGGAFGGGGGGGGGGMGDAGIPGFGAPAAAGVQRKPPKKYSRNRSRSKKR